MVREEITYVKYCRAGRGKVDWAKTALFPSQYQVDLVLLGMEELLLAVDGVFRDRCDLEEISIRGELWTGTDKRYLKMPKM